MARKGVKRTASKAVSSRFGAGVTKKCKTIASTIRGAEDLPQPVRSMLCDMLGRTFSTYKEDRHPLQAATSDLVGVVLQGKQGKLESAIAQAQQKKTALETEAAAATAANDAATASCDAAAKALAGSKVAMMDSKTALKDARTALHDLELAGKTAEANATAAATKKEKLESLITDCIAPTRDGTKGGQRNGAHVGKELASNASSLESDFLTCVVKTFSKTAGSWGTFDNLIDKKLDEALKGIVAGLTTELEGLAAAKGTRVADVEKANGAIVAAEENVKAMEEACRNAATLAKEAEIPAKATTTVVKHQEQQIRQAAEVCDAAKGVLATFIGGPLAAYNELEARAAPPPKAEEAEAAPLVEAAMEPVPPASQQKATTVLPSPGVLLSRAAQAVGFGTSPRVV